MTRLFPMAVYVLCFLTSVACAVLLGRAYVRSRARLLLWSCLCFAALAMNNLFLFLDVVVFPDVNLAMCRSFSAAAGVTILLYGLIWDSD